TTTAAGTDQVGASTDAEAALAKKIVHARTMADAALKNSQEMGVEYMRNTDSMSEYREPEFFTLDGEGGSYSQAWNKTHLKRTNELLVLLEEYKKLTGEDYEEAKPVTTAGGGAVEEAVPTTTAAGTDAKVPREDWDERIRIKERLADAALESGKTTMGFDASGNRTVTDESRGWNKTAIRRNNELLVLLEEYKKLFGEDYVGPDSGTLRESADLGDIKTVPTTTAAGTAAGDFVDIGQVGASTDAEPTTTAVGTVAETGAVSGDSDQVAGLLKENEKYLKNMRKFKITSLKAAQKTDKKSKKEAVYYKGKVSLAGDKQFEIQNKLKELGVDVSSIDERAIAIQSAKTLEDLRATEGGPGEIKASAGAGQSDTDLEAKPVTTAASIDPEETFLGSKAAGEAAKERGLTNFKIKPVLDEFGDPTGKHRIVQGAVEEAVPTTTAAGTDAAEGVTWNKPPPGDVLVKGGDSDWLREDAEALLRLKEAWEAATKAKDEFDRKHIGDITEERKEYDEATAGGWNFSSQSMVPDEYADPELMAQMWKLELARQDADAAAAGKLYEYKKVTGQ
ncbi:MAG: hypothetical protein QGH27_07360, partial [SAR324 cluster bacterium]|nr:hypothetical protein [SAR324 cluster bacterium]